MKPFYIAVLGVFLTFGGCSTASHKSEHSLHQILLYNLHFRRTVLPGADPRAEIGDVRYQSHPVPNKNLDCEPFSQVFKGYSLTPIRECLNQWAKMKRDRLEAGEEFQPVTYLLQRDAAPFLYLESPESAPECLRKVLEEIPVPREIFYQSNEEGHLSCYNSRLEIHGDHPGGVGHLFEAMKVVVMPPQKDLETDDDVFMQLKAWSIAPFWEDRALNAKIVPTEICRRCIGEKNMFNEADVLPPLWPR